MGFFILVLFYFGKKVSICFFMLSNVIKFVVVSGKEWCCEFFSWFCMWNVFVLKGMYI